jgi:phosphoserine phosphatase
MSKYQSRHVATFVAGAGPALDAAQVTQALSAADLLPARLVWLADGVAADAFFPLAAEALGPARAGLCAALAGSATDVIVQAAATRRKALFVADMDSTMIGQECIDELADLVGLRAHVAAITERAMRGEIDFEAALTERVALLKGIRVGVIAELIATRITPNPGARSLVATMRAHGAYTALVSGGFTLFTQPVAAMLGFQEVRANRLDIADGALTGQVVPPILGREAKRAALEDLRRDFALVPEATLAIGDGANDLDMLGAAGLGVAYRAKPRVAEAADARIDHADLTALLYAQGVRREEFAE